MQSESSIAVERSDERIVQIRFNRPDRLNALGVDMTDALERAIHDAVAAHARVLLVRGTGRAFCAGADLKERRTMDEAARIKHNRAINSAVDALAAAPMPTIALINGLALGGGCEIALACDLRYAVEDAQIGLTESRIGAIPGAGGTQRMPRVIGAARALELMLTGEPVSGRRAQEIGLVHAALAEDQLDAHIERIARLIASRSPHGEQTIKRLVHRGLEGTLAEGLALERAALAQILTSADYAEGLAAFAEKRPPRFGEGGAT
ncbi:MAG TPA: enoyl-CoA hydratase-related protein [Burkholderiales bacterium]|nr:enoyl-CoA hydratase-related protein [Burkholderiales bacterium]